ncbi:hypothetical protein B0T22DRAFT_490439 [Podospora appendiculata]|uniref:Uncharacterized protein n=1 Tax=Podospora appendiculata TaxID=314037 RepID=A0AAE0XA71_9PEZI|nr:hypothetical protein B0T22DRAFT_490439 [Podospora appendiculata]
MPARERSRMSQRIGSASLRCRFWKSQSRRPRERTMARHRLPPCLLLLRRVQCRCLSEQRMRHIRSRVNSEFGNGVTLPISLVHLKHHAHFYLTHGTSQRSPSYAQFATSSHIIMCPEPSLPISPSLETPHRLTSMAVLFWSPELEISTHNMVLVDNGGHLKLPRLVCY